ncbi:MAG: SPOR domain-containing protein [Proteobacteria bacterium]|nr:SPOR domain-containing protein [Pseudomonadota bacterium]
MLPRALVLLLLVMNLGALAWWGLHAAPPSSPAPTTDVGTPTLVLLSESEKVQRKGSSDEMAAAPVPDAATPRCQTVGPFAAPADVRRATDILAPLVGRIRQRDATGTAATGYRVYVAALASRDAALEAARQLAAKGINDYYVVTTGDQQNTISLGLFQDLGNATKRRDDVRKLGFDARLDPKIGPVQQYWLDITVAPDFDWHAHLTDFPGIAAQDTPCPSLH